MTKDMLKKLLLSSPYLFSFTNVIAIMDRELDCGEAMDTDLVDCCLYVLDYFGTQNGKPYQTTYSFAVPY